MKSAHHPPFAAGSAEATKAYHPHIDGLRAIAVLPVLLFHAGIHPFSGGYVGVDIFFVISGYLITGIIMKELKQGRYSTIGFYRRRARRIFPALTIVCASTICAGYVVLPPREYTQLAKSALAITFFSSNIFFWKSVGYFDAGEQMQPLLHTWSLAVEEQYYIFYPFLLMLIAERTKLLRPILWSITLASLASSIVLVPIKPMAAFYLLPPRAWELMLGGLLASGAVPLLARARLAAMASLTGLGLIVGSVFLYNSQTAFPGLAAIPPCSGTALIIWTGGRTAIGRFLSLKPVVLVGQASYSLYLWHVPVFDFARYLIGGPLPFMLALGLCALCLALAFATLYLVEQPFRKRSGARQANVLALTAFAGVLLIAFVSSVIISTRGMPGRINRLATEQLAVAQDQSRHHLECMSLDRVRVPPEQACLLGKRGVQPTVLLWGDSHAMVTATAMEQAAARGGGSFLFSADADCPPGVGFSIDSSVSPQITTQGHYRFCSEYNRRMLELALRSPNIKTVVISSRWTNWRVGEPPNPVEGEADIRLVDGSGIAKSVQENEAKWKRGFQALIEGLTDAGKQVVIVGPLPEPPYDVPHQLYINRFGLAQPVTSVALPEYFRRHAKILRYLTSISGPNISFVWPSKALCSSTSCPLVQDGRALYFDQDHLSILGATKTSHLYDRLFTHPEQ